MELDDSIFEIWKKFLSSPVIEKKVLLPHISFQELEKERDIKDLFLQFQIAIFRKFHGEYMKCGLFTGVKTVSHP